MISRMMTKKNRLNSRSPSPPTSSMTPTQNPSTPLPLPQRNGTASAAVEWVDCWRKPQREGLPRNRIGKRSLRRNRVEPAHHHQQLSFHRNLFLIPIPLPILRNHHHPPPFPALPILSLFRNPTQIPIPIAVPFPAPLPIAIPFPLRTPKCVVEQ